MCTFESSTICGYTQDKTDQFDWIRQTGPTGSVGTGPSTDHTTSTRSGHYMYIETSGARRPNDTARLISPQYHLQGTGSQCVTFWYHMYGIDTNTLNVYAAPGGSPNSRGQPVWSRSFNQGNAWRKGQATISPSGDYQVIMCYNESKMSRHIAKIILNGHLGSKINQY